MGPPTSPPLDAHPNPPPCPTPHAPPRHAQALSFLKTLFEKWNAQSVTHSVSVVFTCRTMWGREGWSRRFSAGGLEGRAMHASGVFPGVASPFHTPRLGASGPLPPGGGPGGTLKRTPDGRFYEDFYQVWSKC